MTQVARKVTVPGLWMTPLDKRAFIKLIRHYYKGRYNIRVKFDKRIGDLGNYIFDAKKKTHLITISPKKCRLGRSNTRWLHDEMIATSDLVRMNRHDTVCQLIFVLLHELKHAAQHDRNPQAWSRDKGRHESIIQSRMTYLLSPSESEAEGWALLNFNKALERYERWCNE